MKTKELISRLAFGLAILPVVCIRAEIVYVSPTGNDATNDGSLAKPFGTVMHAINHVGPGDHTVYLRGGVYRERIEITSAVGSADGPLKLFAYPGEIPVIKGSDLVKTGWEPACAYVPPGQCSENIWRVPWPPAGVTVGQDYLSPQQVFLNNDTPLIQIGYRPQYDNVGINYYTPIDANGDGQSTILDMTPGSFYYDDNSQYLYVWLPGAENPTIDDIEVAARLRVLFNHRDDLHVKGVWFRHSNVSSFMQFGEMVDIGDFGIIEDCDIQWGDFGGLKVREGNLVKNCNIKNNGAVGINVNGQSSVAAYDFEISGNRISGNNYRSFNPSWHAGGIKVTTSANGRIIGNVISDNYGSGVWYDGCSNGWPAYISRNYIHGNRIVFAGNTAGEGVHIEISSNVRVYNNVITDQEVRGIYLSASDDNVVGNNTIIGMKGNAAIEVNGLPRTDGSGNVRSLRRNQIINNLIYDTGAGIDDNQIIHDLLLSRNNACIDRSSACAGPDHPDGDWIVTGNVSNNNLVYRASDSLRKILFKIAGEDAVYTDINEWSAATGWDMGSHVADPGFEVQTEDMYIPGVSSIAIDNGLAVADLADDYVGNQRAQGVSYDIGAYELPAECICADCSVVTCGLVASNGSASVAMVGNGQIIGAEAAGDVAPASSGGGCTILVGTRSESAPLEYWWVFLAFIARGACRRFSLHNRSAKL